MLRLSPHSPCRPAEPYLIRCPVTGVAADQRRVRPARGHCDELLTSSRGAGGRVGNRNRSGQHAGSGVGHPGRLGTGRIVGDSSQSSAGSAATGPAAGSSSSATSGVPSTNSSRPRWNSSTSAAERTAGSRGGMRLGSSGGAHTSIRTRSGGPAADLDRSPAAVAEGTAAAGEPVASSGRPAALPAGRAESRKPRPIQPPTLRPRAFDRPSARVDSGPRRVLIRVPAAAAPDTSDIQRSPVPTAGMTEPVRRDRATYEHHVRSGDQNC